MKSKYGFVALLDALGSKTATIEEAADYLRKLQVIENEVTTTLRSTLKTEHTHSGEVLDPKIFRKIQIRTFGDTLLITYEVKNREKESDYLARISYVLRLFLCRSFSLGIMFRGSLALGSYVDKKSVVLGPAVADAASWYEKLDMMGCILTPATTLAVKSILTEGWGCSELPKSWQCDFVLGKHAAKEPLKMDLLAINWVDALEVSLKVENEEGDERKWFYNLIRRFPIPAGTESKYANSECFFEANIASVIQNRKEAREAYEQSQQAGKK